MTVLPADAPALPPDPSAPRSRWPLGCALAAALVAGLPLGAGALWAYTTWRAHQAALAEQAAHAEEVFAPALEQLAPKEPEIDLDATIRVVHEVDLALQEKGNLDEWLRFAATRDHRGVAPEVLEARLEILQVLQELYARQTEAEEQQAVWEMTGEMLLSTLSVVQVSGHTGVIGPTGSLSVDRKQARELLDDMKERQDERAALLRDIDELDAELFTALNAYAEVYWSYVEQWDRLSLLRDRAWLAAASGDWEAAAAAAEIAIQQAPKEREAHLILAMALIESNEPESLDRAATLLDQYIQDHPDHSAPAFLLMGVLQERRGNAKEARLLLQQSAAYYPRQAENLDDMLDPYAMRAYLRRSREGATIVEQYRSMMLGAGYFSPDLELARTLFDEGQAEAARAKVLDHFARRRAQQQWDFVLSDLQFCHDLLGPDYWKIFPEDRWLDLEISHAMFGGGLNVGVRNRSDKTLHNATLVLVLHFTDMVPGDYEALAAGRTVPAVVAHETTDFDTVTIDVEVGGVKKQAADIVQHRAILVTNEAVVWVDTDEFRIAESDAFAERRKQEQAAANPAPAPPSAEDRYPTFDDTVDELVRQATQVATLEVESRYGKDDVLIELPKELAILRPLFRLRRNGELFTATDNVIEGDRIQLRFSGVENFDDVVVEGALELVASTPFGEITFTWAPGGDLTWRLGGAARQ